MDLRPADVGFDANRLDRIAAHLDRHYIQPGKIAGCQVAVGRHGQLAYSTSLGLRDRERGVALGDDTIFRIYSMTKPLTSIALMQLFEQGMLQLDDPVARFVPSWRNHRVWVSGSGDDMVTEPAHRPVSFRDLLSHTSGITYGGVLPGMGDQHPVDERYRALQIRSAGVPTTMAEFLEKLSQVPLRFQPGTAYMYSLATDVCGALVETMSGQPFAEYLQQHILGPLAMTDTSFQVAPDNAHRFAGNYARNADKTTTLMDDAATSAFTKPPAFVSGGGGLTGTVADYTRFCEMLRRGGELDGQRILGPRTLDMMRLNQLPGGKDLASVDVDLQELRGSVGVGFGLGFASTIDQVATGGLSRGDYYWGGAASTVFWVDPIEDLWVVFMTQLMPSNSFDFRGQLRSLVYSAIID
ncbi:MAG TPA: serine hydrolase domain-containing protein [Ilumatobacteraceae bacterium]|nr:serine hydrolase domain-containing protein [Ilumatobacteraceae bacterium]HRB01828.1 serine hydrolase domain-containing protein [Ilumatobacteraceae bacterium]